MSECKDCLFDDVEVIQAKKMLFRDVHAQTDGVITFSAAGIVEEYYGIDESASVDSGKHMTVTFIDPTGGVCHEWRSVYDVIVTEVSESEYEVVERAINEVIYE